MYKASKVLYFLSSIFTIAWTIMLFIIAILGLAGAVKFIPNGFNPYNYKVAYVLLLIASFVEGFYAFVNVRNYIKVSHNDFSHRNNCWHFAAIILGVVGGGILMILASIFAYLKGKEKEIEEKYSKKEDL